MAAVSQPRTSPQPAKEAYRVLVVDDNVASAKTLGWTLELFGHKVTLGHDAATAMAAAKHTKPQIVMLDIGLPGVNGYDLCRLMRAQPETKDAIIIAQTGWAHKEHYERSEAAGFNHYLIKPLNIKALDELLISLKERVAQ